MAGNVVNHEARELETEDRLLSAPELIDYFGFELGCDLQDVSIAPDGKGISAALWNIVDAPEIVTPPLGCHLFSLCLSGEGQLMQTHFSEPVDVASEQCFFTPKGARLRVRQTGSASLLHIMIEDEMLAASRRAVMSDGNPDDLSGLHETAGWNGVFDPGMHATALMILTELVTGGLHEGFVAPVLAQALALQIVRRIDPTKCDPGLADMKVSKQKMDAIFSFVHRNLVLPLTAEKIAKATDVDVSELITAFHMRLGVDPLGYVERTRALRAWLLINVLGTDASEAAARCGYNSPEAMHDSMDRVSQQTSPAERSSFVN